MINLRLITAFLLSFCSISIFGQINSIQNAQGIKQEEVTFFDTEGYSVFIKIFDYDFDEKGLNKVRKKLSIAKDLDYTADTLFKNTKIINTTTSEGNVTAKTIYFFSQTNNDKIKAISFSTICERSKDIEKQFYDSIILNNIPAETFTTNEVDTVDFAGRRVALGPACRWMGVRNLQCPNMGQINWSEFSKIDRAKQMIEGQKELNKNMKLGEILEENEIEIVFEGNPVKVVKRKTKIKIPQLIMGGSNILIIYYVISEVRGRYVACVLSHYTDDIGANNLPPLLSELMSLKK